MDLPIFVDPDEQPVSEDEMHEVASAILEKETSGDGVLLAQLVLAWLDWKPPGWEPPAP